VGRPGCALCRGRRPDAALRAPPRPGRHHHPARARSLTAIRYRLARPPARARRCSPTTWRRLIRARRRLKPHATPSAQPFTGQKDHSLDQRASDINKEYCVDLGLIGDAGLLLDALIEEVGRQKGAARGGNALTRSRRRSQLPEGVLAEWAKHFDLTSADHQYRVIRDLMRTVDPEHVILTHDSGQPARADDADVGDYDGGLYMGWGKSTQLGYGSESPWGRSSRTDKLCINVMGDAAIGMTGMDIELPPATRSRSSPSCSTTASWEPSGGARDLDKKYGGDDGERQLQQVAEGLNVASTRVEKPDHSVPAIKEAVAVTEKGSPFLWSSCQGRATTSRATILRGCSGTNYTSLTSS